MRHRILAVLAVCIGLTGTGHANAEIRLRAEAQPAGDTITLGDLFTGLDGKANVIVGPAPAAGSQATFQIKHIQALARIHGLDWRPDGSEAPVVISRTGQQFGRADVLARLKAELAALGHTGSLEIDLAGRLFDADFRRTGSGLSVRQLNIDPISGQFTADLVVLGQANQREQLPLNGRILSVRRVPVVQRLIRRGDTIANADVGWAVIRTVPGSRRVVEQLDEVVGQAARRTLRPGNPLEAADLTAPILVRKGSLVTVSLHAPGLSLSSTGRALEDASIGDAVKIMNPHSKRVIDATVIGPAQVKVRLRRQITVAANQ